jgi:uracil-DNA glycosylase family 4
VTDDRLDGDRSPAQRASELAVAQAAARACRRCVEAGHLRCAAPVFAGDATCRVMLIGQAPGRLSRDAARPFAGPSGAVLGDWFRRAGFADDYFPERVYCTSVTRCFPGPARTGGDRPPSPAERGLCRPWLDAELRLVRPDVVLLVGQVAIAELLPTLAGRPLASLVGALIQERDSDWIPLPHPSGASRWLNAPANKALVDRALSLLSEARQRRKL